MSGAVSKQGDQARAAAALNLAGGGDSAGAQDMLQRSKTRAIRTRIVVVLGCMLIGGAVGLTLGDRGRASVGTSVAHWRTVAGPALSIVALLLELVVIVARVRSGQFKAGWRSPTLALSRSQRRGVMRQIRGRVAVDETMLPVSRHLAELLRQNRSIVGLFVAVPLIFVGQALPHNAPFRWWLATFMVIVYLVLIIFMYRDSARAERFLTHYPQDRPAQQQPWTSGPSGPLGAM
jgi:hypothetical protein